MYNSWLQVGLSQKCLVFHPFPSGFSISYYISLAQYFPFISNQLMHIKGAARHAFRTSIQLSHVLQHSYASQVHYLLLPPCDFTLSVLTSTPATRYKATTARIFNLHNSIHQQKSYSKPRKNTGTGNEYWN